MYVHMHIHTKIHTHINVHVYPTPSLPCCRCTDAWTWASVIYAIYHRSHIPPKEPCVLSKEPYIHSKHIRVTRRQDTCYLQTRVWYCDIYIYMKDFVTLPREIHIYTNTHTYKHKHIHTHAGIYTIDWFWLRVWLINKGAICTGTASVFWKFVSLFGRPRTRLVGKIGIQNQSIGNSRLELDSKMQDLLKMIRRIYSYTFIQTHKHTLTHTHTHTHAHPQTHTHTHINVLLTDSSLIWGGYD